VGKNLFLLAKTVFASLVFTTAKKTVFSTLWQKLSNPDQSNE